MPKAKEQDVVIAVPRECSNGTCIKLLGVHIVQGVPCADESVCRASSFVWTVSSRTSNDGVVL